MPGRSPRNSFLTDVAPVRDELFGVERLEQHARSLAEAQTISTARQRVDSLHRRLADNAATLLSAYQGCAAELKRGRGVPPAAEWLLDNYHLVEEQVREIRDHLPVGFYRQLPKLAGGPFAGYPRVFGIAWAYVAHTDSYLDPEILRRFIVAYQTVEQLTIGELWAIAITLRIVLIENLRRLADEITLGLDERNAAEALANWILAPTDGMTRSEGELDARAPDPLPVQFGAYLVKHFRDREADVTPASSWLQRRLEQQARSTDEIVQEANHQQAVSNVSVRNVITSMRLISDIGWADLVESVSLVDARLRAGSAFAEMDFPSRNLYRSAIEALARGSSYSETAVAERALRAARISRERAPNADEAARQGDPGYHLVAAGRPAFEESLGFVPSIGSRLGRNVVRLGIVGYLESLLLVTLLLLATVVVIVGPTATNIGWIAAFAALILLPLTEAATAIVNRTMNVVVGARPIPGLELAAGVPASLRTLVVVPTLLHNEGELKEQIERLEVHFLSESGGEIHFALLADFVDADREHQPEDDTLIAIAVARIAELNTRHTGGDSGPRFFFFHRRRQYNAPEGEWMGWERKRGKLHELNRLLRGATDTSYVLPEGHAAIPPDVRYVVTLDADTRLPRDTALRLIGKIAHPLNRPRFDAVTRRVVDGHAILQPRIAHALPFGANGSTYQRIFSGPSGIDPYSAVISNVYQDLFDEGSFTGKGIYDVDAFEAALAHRVPDNAMLSHDLFEGIFARSGLASDVEFVEDFPTRYDVDAKRQHRWTRGDWQLLPWIVGHWKGPDAVPSIGRWKMLDNIRRSLVALASVACVGLAAILPQQRSDIAMLLTVASLAVPIFLPAFFTLASRPQRASLRAHLKTFAHDIMDATLQTALSLTMLADRAWRMGDAIVRTLVRMLFTRRHLLEWTTAAQSARLERPDVRASYRQMIGGVGLALALTAATLLVEPSAWPLVLPFAVLWTLAPLVAVRASRPTAEILRVPLSPAEAQQLRLIGRRTWRYFETFVTADDHWLPPDNFQVDPRPIVARRTSPTNLGLYLLSALSARDLGWSGTLALIERLEATLDSMRRLQKFNGHYFNWYGTADLRALEPPYISSVDSGNLAGHLLALANACESMIEAPCVADVRAGLEDPLFLASETLRAIDDDDRERKRQWAAVLVRIETLLHRTRDMATIASEMDGIVERAGLGASAGVDEDAWADVAYWVEAIRRTAAEHARDGSTIESGAEDVTRRLEAIAREAREIAFAMDFAFLFDDERKLLSIGYSLADNRLDPSCYDLLASEARLASLFAIAKGDIPTRHWFRLGRASTPVANGTALVSWSGSMFEYLMPSLVMRAPYGSLLEQTNRLVVLRQRGYGASLGIPWGVSESAYNARDLEFTYQYSNFGVPGLGLKRGLADDIVIAPYASGLATMVDAHAAIDNFARLSSLGARGRYGFYDALDFTKSRVPEGANVAIVRNYMAHHQGMTIVAIANALQDGLMRARFHAEPVILASELLLQERMPRDVADAHPRAEEVEASKTATDVGVPSVRRVRTSAGGAPVTHLLSNGRYTVMLTASGSGYSRWGETAVTRWREDPTRDAEGSYLFLRDVETGRVWSATTQPLGVDVPDAEVLFGEESATFTRREGRLMTTTEVAVSGEDDGEVRRVSLTNSSRRAREIELTSYSEVVLAAVATDNAHPAFAKMFVQTERLEAFDALIATRRRRSPDEAEVWCAHFVVIEGMRTAPMQFETDRARFIGRSRTLANAAAMADGEKLSDTVGTVLDPIFSLRCQVRVPAGGMARISFWTVIASSNAELFDLLDRHHDRSAFDRAKTFAWTRAQVELRHLGVTAEEATEFQRLAAPIIYADGHFRAPSGGILRGMGPQSALWPHAISGDLPIVVLRIDDVDDMAQVRQLLRAHEYWRAKRLAVDLVILNERASSYVQDLQIAIETAVRSTQARPPVQGTMARGTVYALRADLLGAEGRALLYAVARVLLNARRGPLSLQLAQLSKSSTLLARRPLDADVARRAATAEIDTAVDTGRLEFFNGTGGFDQDGREYAIVMRSRRATPAPWINVISNPSFGFGVSADGSGCTWAENSRDNQLTPWTNDPVLDPTGEVFYVRDEQSREIWTPTAQPIRDEGVYVARHGFGFSRFEHRANGIDLELLQFVAPADPVKISRLRIRNRSERPRRLSLTLYVEWVLGTSRNTPSPFIATEIDGATGAMIVRNHWGTAFPRRVTFVDLRGLQSAYTGDRTEFLGRNGDASAPAALTGRAPLSGTTGAGFDPCTALQCVVDVAPGATVDLVASMGQCANDADARELVERYRGVAVDDVLADVTGRWTTLLGSVQVKTPDRAMDIMLNGWLLYQALACRVWARSAFYQASGAYGFRDQLQDGMALTFAMPEQTRAHLLRSAGRQFVEGDVQHWWLPHSGQGVRTHISDDRVWLAYAAANYIETTGDAAVLDEPLPWLEGAPLRPDEHDAFFEPAVSDETAPLFEHCARALDQCIALTGEHGLPLMGTGDWNDGMNRVGQAGRGESVWLAWLLIRTIDLFAPHADRHDPGRATRWRAHAARVATAIESVAWDGDWYRRATFDDGTWLGSKDSDECRIDSIAQSWAVLSKTADATRAATAMASVDRYLLRRDDRLALLFTPPFDHTAHDPGYIKGYPPGLRENGGQYTHAAMWAIFAFVELREPDKAVELFSLLNPINHASTRQGVERYRVEPYVVAADVYSIAPHAGRGGWTWYTGSAAWMVRAGIEGILGIVRRGASLAVRPRLPSEWPECSITVRLDATRFDIRYVRGDGDPKPSVVVDGGPRSGVDEEFLLPIDGHAHDVVFTVP